jgi:hypothetical protein
VTKCIDSLSLESTELEMPAPRDRDRRRRSNSEHSGSPQSESHRGRARHKDSRSRSRPRRRDSLNSPTRRILDDSESGEEEFQLNFALTWFKRCGTSGVLCSKKFLWKLCS